jgi:hypothetical protein
MTTSAVDLDEALTELGRIEGDFRDCEDLYFKGRASVEQLRAAWNRRHQARRRVDEARRQSGTNHQE